MSSKRCRLLLQAQAAGASNDALWVSSYSVYTPLCIQSLLIILCLSSTVALLSPLSPLLGFYFF